jgi:hypothetical protein
MQISPPLLIYRKSIFDLSQIIERGVALGMVAILKENDIPKAE